MSNNYGKLLVNDSLIFSEYFLNKVQGTDFKVQGVMVKA